MKDITKDENESEDDDLYVSSIVKVGELPKMSKSIWKETMEVNGKAVKFKIDTGSEINIIPLEMYNSRGWESTNTTNTDTTTSIWWNKDYANGESWSNM